MRTSHQPDTNVNLALRIDHIKCGKSSQRWSALFLALEICSSVLSHHCLQICRFNILRCCLRYCVQCRSRPIGRMNQVVLLRCNWPVEDGRIVLKQLRCIWITRGGLVELDMTVSRLAGDHDRPTCRRFRRKSLMLQYQLVVSLLKGWSQATRLLAATAT